MEEWGLVEKFFDWIQDPDDGDEVLGPSGGRGALTMSFIFTHSFISLLFCFSG